MYVVPAKAGTQSSILGNLPPSDTTLVLMPTDLGSFNTPKGHCHLQTPVVIGLEGNVALRQARVKGVGGVPVIGDTGIDRRFVSDACGERAVAVGPGRGLEGRTQY